MKLVHRFVNFSESDSLFLLTLRVYFVGLDSSVAMVTHYGLDGPGNESRCGRDFPHPPRPCLWSNQWVPGPFSMG